MVLAVLSLAALPSPAADVSSLARNEVRRREVLVREAGARLTEADGLFQAGKFEEAVNAYSQVYQSLPKAAIAAPARDHARAGFSAASCQRARQLMAEGRYAEATTLLDNILAPDVNPGYADAVRLRKEFQDPDRFPRALTPQHITTVKDVERRLELANSALEIGDYDRASTVYQEVLRLDPYNKSARRGMERVEQKKAEYFESARDHTRAKLLSAVDGQWEQQIPPTSADMSGLFASGNSPAANARSGRDAINQKLRTMIVPKVDFSGATLEEVIEYIRVRSRDLDPKGRGVDFVMNVPPESSAKLISLYLEHVPMEDVLRYATEKAGAAYRVEDRAVTIISLTENSTQLIPKTYRVPPNFIQNSFVGDAAPAGGAAPADPFAKQPAGGAGLGVRRMGAKEFLESRGVTFIEGASAAYVPTTNSLFVRNTPDNLAIVDMLVDQASTSAPKQVIVSVKLMEVNQKNFDEFATDIGFGAANIPGSDRAFVSGGSASPTLFIPGVNSTTNGLQPSGAILGTPSIDSLLTNSNTPPVNSISPVSFQLLGAFTDPQFQLLAQAISQKKGTDLVSVPSIIMKSGVKTEIEMVKEFPYPTEFDPPQIPQTVGSSTGSTFLNGALTSSATASANVPITPTTPTNFEVRKVGSLLEVEAVVSEDGRQVELTLAPSTTEFEGFIDYGSDIQNSTNSLNFDPVAFAYTSSSTPFTVDNPILQPVFRTNKLSTAVLVWDGSTVILGGVLSEKKSQITDKVPLLGDLPIIGRLWQEKITQVERKNVLFFVTVKVIDSAGQPLRPVATASAR